jgi:hypothetical protein
VGQLDQRVHVATQIRALLERQPRDIRTEQMTDGHRAKVFIAFRIKGHIGENAHAQTQLHVSLDHVRINSFQYDVGCQIAQRERLVDFRAAGERVVVRDDRVLGEVIER